MGKNAIRPKMKTPSTVDYLFNARLLIKKFALKPNLHPHAPNPAGASTHPSFSMLAGVMCSKAQLSRLIVVGLV